MSVSVISVPDGLGHIQVLPIPTLTCHYRITFKVKYKKRYSSLISFSTRLHIFHTGCSKKMLHKEMSDFLYLSWAPSSSELYRPSTGSIQPHLQGWYYHILACSHKEAQSDYKFHPAINGKNIVEGSDIRNKRLQWDCDVDWLNVRGICNYSIPLPPKKQNKNYYVNM